MKKEIVTKIIDNKLNLTELSIKDDINTVKLSVGINVKRNMKELGLTKNEYEMVDLNFHLSTNVNKTVEIESELFDEHITKTLFILSDNVIKSALIGTDNFIQQYNERNGLL